MHPARIKSGELVEYDGRAGRIVGVAADAAAGRCLAIALRVPSNAVVLVPLEKAARLVRPVGVSRAAYLDANPPIVSLAAKHIAKVRARMSADAKQRIALGRERGAAAGNAARRVR